MNAHSKSFLRASHTQFFFCKWKNNWAPKFVVYFIRILNTNRKPTINSLTIRQILTHPIISLDGVYNDVNLKRNRFHEMTRKNYGCLFLKFISGGKTKLQASKNILFTYENKLSERFLHNADLFGTNLLQLPCQRINRVYLEQKPLDLQVKLCICF